MALQYYDKKAKMAEAVYEYIGLDGKPEQPLFKELKTKMFLQYGFNEKAVRNVFKEFGWVLDELEQLKQIKPKQ